MPRFFLLIILCAMTACANSQRNNDEGSTTIPNPITQSERKEIPKKYKVREMTKEDIEKQSRQKYIIDKSRPTEEIEKSYPYDIDLKKADGSVVKSDAVLDKNGKPTVLMFWLTTCVPCRYEMAAVKEKYEQWQKEEDFNLYAISTDFSKNYDAFVRMVNENNWPWESVNDVNREFRKVMPGALNGLPQTFIIDKNGEIAYHKRKYRKGDEDALFAKIKELNSKR